MSPTADLRDGLVSLLGLFARLPVPLALAAAAASGLLLHEWASLPTHRINALAGSGYVARMNLLQALSVWLQGVLPALFIAGAVARGLRGRRADGVPATPGTDLRPPGGVPLCQGIETALRRHGYGVFAAGSGPADAHELLLRHDDRLYLVHCAGPRFPRRVALLRGLRARIAGDAFAGLIVCGDGFSLAQRCYARRRNIELIDAPRLRAMLARSPSPA